MPDNRIVIPEKLGDVIKVDGDCYEFQELTTDPVTQDPTNPEDFATCQECESGSDTSSSINDCPDPGVCPTNCDSCPALLVQLSGFGEDLVSCAPDGDGGKCSDLNINFPFIFEGVNVACQWAYDEPTDQNIPSGSNNITLDCSGGQWTILIDIDLSYDSGCWILAQWTASFEACGEGTCPPPGTYPLTYVPASNPFGPDPCTGPKFVTIS